MPPQEPSPFGSTLGGSSGGRNSGPSIVWTLTANHSGVQKSLQATIQLLDTAKAKVDALTASFQKLQQAGQMAGQVISGMAQRLLGGGSSGSAGGMGAGVGGGFSSGRFGGGGSVLPGPLALPSVSRGLPAIAAGSTLVVPSSRALGVPGSALPVPYQSRLPTPSSENVGAGMGGWNNGYWNYGGMGGGWGGGGGSGGSGGWWSKMPGPIQGMGALLASQTGVNAAVSLGTAFQKNIPGGTALDLATRQLMQQAGMTNGYTTTGVAQMMRTIHGRIGNFNYGATDQANAIEMLLNSDAMRGGNAKQSMGNSLNLLRASAQISALNPSLGLSGSTQSLLSLTNPAVANRLGPLGAGLLKPGGGVQTNMNTLFHSLLELVSTGSGYGTSSNAALQNLARNGQLSAGGAGAQSLEGLGVSPELVAALRQYAAAGLPNMGKVMTNQSYANQHGFYSLATSQQKVAGSAGFRQGALTEAQSGYIESVNQFKTHLNDMVGNLTDLNRTTQALVGGLGDASHMFGIMAHAGQTAIDFLVTLGKFNIIRVNPSGGDGGSGGGSSGPSGGGGGGGGGCPSCGGSCGGCCGGAMGGGSGWRVRGPKGGKPKSGGGGGWLRGLIGNAAASWLGGQLRNMPGGSGGEDVPIEAAFGAGGPRGSFLNVPPSTRPQAGKGGAGGGLTGAEIVAKASQYLGVPYSWGGGHGNGPTTGIGYPADTVVGFDCSGLVQTVMDQLGVPFPRTTYTQVKMGTPVASLGQAQPGDLVFFAGSDGTMTNPGHVGIYVGNGNMIDAFATGTDVRVEPVSDAGPVAAIRRVAAGGAGISSASVKSRGSKSGGTSTAGGTPVTLPGFFGNQYGSVNTTSLIQQLLSSSNAPMVGVSGGASPQGPQPSGGSSISGGKTNAAAGSTSVVGAVKAITAVLADPTRYETALAMLMGSYLESNANPTSPLNPGGAAGAWQIQLNAHPGVTAAQAENVGWAANFMFPSYMSGVQGVPSSMWKSNPMMAGEQAAYLAERPAAPYIDTQGPGRVQSAYQWATSQLGNYESGAWRIGQDQLSVIHAGEMVLPKEPAEALRRGVQQGRTSSGGVTFQFGPGSIVVGAMSTQAQAENLFEQLQKIATAKGLTLK